MDLLIKIIESIRWMFWTTMFEKKKLSYVSIQDPPDKCAEWYTECVQN